MALPQGAYGLSAVCVFPDHTHYNLFLVYCRELASGTVSLTGDRAQGDDSKHDSHFSIASYFQPCDHLLGKGCCLGPGVVLDRINS